MDIVWIVVGSGGYILAIGGWWGVSGYILRGGGWCWIYFGWWWVVLDIFSLVVDIFWLVVGGGGWWHSLA